VAYDDSLRLLIDPDPQTDVPAAPVQKNFAFCYPEQGWGVVADRWPEPNVYAAFRGGIAAGAHTHADLLSWHGVMGMERMILDYNKAGYYSPSFYGRAREIYERNPASKNTLFIGGVSAILDANRGRRGPPRADGTRFDLPIGPAVRLNATRAFFLASDNPTLVARAFIVVRDKGILVLDRIEQPGRNPIEVRTHTDRRAEFGKTDVLLRGDFEAARMCFGSDRACVLQRAEAMLTDARATPPTVMRWQTLNSERNVTMASFLSRGSDPVGVEVSSDKETVNVNLSGNGWRERIQLTNRIEPIGTTSPTTREADE
jgi:hypothetical protein